MSIINEQVNNTFDFYTSHHQFYIYDKFSEDNSSDFWSDQAYSERLAIGTGLLGISTESYGQIKGEINLLEQDNITFDIGNYDHIVEGSLDINSGVLQILNCPNSCVELELVVTPGIYRVRVYSKNLASYLEEINENDYYKIEVWPDRYLDRKVLKQFPR